MAYVQLVAQLKEIEPDMIIRCSDGEVKAVKALMMAASGSFRSMLRSSKPSKEGDEIVINFEEEKRSTVSAFVNYAQYGEIKGDVKMLCHLSMLFEKHSVSQCRVIEVLMHVSENPLFADTIVKICVANCHYGLRRKASKSFFTQVFHGWHYVCKACGHKAVPRCQYCKELSITSRGACEMGHEPFNRYTHSKCRKRGQYAPKRLDIPMPKDSLILGEMVRLYTIDLHNTPNSIDGDSDDE